VRTADNIADEIVVIIEILDVDAEAISAVSQ